MDRIAGKGGMPNLFNWDENNLPTCEKCIGDGVDGDGFAGDRFGTRAGLVYGGVVTGDASDA